MVSVHVQTQLAQDQFPVLAVVLVLLEEAFKVVLYQEVDLLEDLDQLLAISAEVQTTLLGTVCFSILLWLGLSIQIWTWLIKGCLGQAQAMKCYACGKLGHISRDCTAPNGGPLNTAGKTCYQCGEAGHM